MPHTHAHTDHDHGHGLLRALILTAGFAVIETGGGLAAHSLALLSDAAHMATDVFALVLALIAARLAGSPATHRLSFGLARTEVLAALINVLLMMLLTGGIVLAAWQRLQTPGVAVRSGIMFLIGGIGFLVNSLSAYSLMRHRGNLNVRAALLHVLGDMAGSLATLIAAAVIHFTGWEPIDPLLSLVSAVFILVSAIHILRESLHVLLEGVPGHIDFKAVGEAMTAIENVRAVHDLHIWTTGNDQVVLSAHVVIEDLQRWPSILSHLEALLHDRYGIEQMTVQPEMSGPAGLLERCGL